jgi:FixJ family two-component response regulator
LRTGKHSARMQTRARILLQVHEGQTDQAIATNLRVHLSTVERMRLHQAESFGTDHYFEAFGQVWKASCTLYWSDLWVKAQKRLNTG